MNFLANIFVLEIEAISHKLLNTTFEGMNDELPKVAGQGQDVAQPPDRRTPVSAAHPPGSGALKGKKKRWRNGLQETLFYFIILFFLKCPLLTLLCFKFTYPENDDINTT